MSDIDFVITWVDGNDEKWQNEKNKYDEKTLNVNNNINRYRDWELLKYWFRGVDKFTPWVNKIFFITYGHLPEWLDTKNPKIRIIKHSDYIPEQYLPTFSSHPIELNIHRIKELSEKFVYFNDDMLIVKKMEESDFFKNGLPREVYIENCITTSGVSDSFPHILLNNSDVINRNFSKREIMHKNFFKHFNLKYGINNCRTISLLLWKRYSTFYNHHIATSFLKSTFEKVWEKEYEILDNTCKNKFRNVEDVNQYIMKDWQLAEGNFSPRKVKIGKYFSISDDTKEIVNSIVKQKYNMICLNDEDEKIDFEKTKSTIKQALESILPDKSSFEIMC